MNHPVVIAGAGPAGLMLACELGLAGVPSVVLDARPEPAEVSQGMAVHGRTLEAFKQRGLADRIDPQHIFAWPRTPFALLWLDISDAEAHDLTYAFPQWRTERLLAERAAELGAEIRRGHRLTGFTQDADGVRISVAADDGAYELEAGHLVGADGGRSTVRELAGIGVEQIGPTFYGIMGDTTFEPGMEFDAGLRSAGMFAAMPIGGDTLRLMTVEFEHEAPGDDVEATVEELRASIERVSGKNPNVGKVGWVSRFGNPTTLAERYRSGRVFLVGDAAHTLFVSGTQGLNTGIHDAMNLGWKLAATINGWAPADLLDTYEAERRPFGARMCWHSLVTMRLLHPLERVEQLRNLVAGLLESHEVNQHMLRMTTTARYPEPAATEGGEADTLTGIAVADITLETAKGDESLANLMNGGRGLLLDFSEGSADLDATAGWEKRVDVVTAKPNATLPASVVLVRPDGHIAYAGDATGDGLVAALRTWFGEPVR